MIWYLDRVGRLQISDLACNDFPGAWMEVLHFVDSLDASPHKRRCRTIYHIPDHPERTAIDSLKLPDNRALLDICAAVTAYIRLTGGEFGYAATLPEQGL